MVDVKIKIVKDGKLPCFKHEGDAAADCYARLPTEKITLLKGKRTLIPLGFCIEVPEEWEVQIRPRSGLSAKGIDVAFGTGDSSYRGEYMANVINNSDVDFDILNGDRICQMAIREVPKVSFYEVAELSETERVDKGFGSSGLRG